MKLVEKIEQLDKSGMFNHLKNFANQLHESIEIARDSAYFLNKNKNLILLGIGGSAIAGDLLQAYFRNNRHAEVDIYVNRNYFLFKNVDEKTNIIVSSYSGNTEETLSAYDYVKGRTKNIIGITSGGRLKEILRKDGYPTIEIPKGLQPREALGYSFFTLLLVLWKSFGSQKEFENIVQHLNELYEFLLNRGNEYSQKEENKASSLAKQIKNKILIVYACEETLTPVAMRIKAQIQENAKNLCFFGTIPEMNHNEINSFRYPEDIISKLKVLILKDRNDHPKNQKRIEATYSILSKSLDVEIVESKENDFLFRMFDILYFFDWVSFYLALENNIDPTPIPIITELKNFIQS
ncbi:MAG: bifunctional phosphoglucose/phosphomannose isomerase [Candidatus Kapaibacteriota bacterium]|jgi:glucose/mannose-6-phosphate isomerase